MPDLKRVNVLGVGISAINMTMALEVIEGWLRRGEKHYVSVVAASEVVQCQRDLNLRRAINGSGMATPDGMPLVWLARLHGERQVSRVYGPDLVLALCERTSGVGDNSHYFYGGSSEVVNALVEKLRLRYPRLRIAGAFAPPYRELSADEDSEVVNAINRSGADIVWVGLGGAKQNLWMAEHLDRLSASVLIGVGAAFDFHSGRKKQAPRWMMWSGLEWVFRLSQEPRRLWRRYIITVPVFVGLTALQLLGLKRYSLSDDG